ncbi:hypothetical protein PSH28_10650 [Pseudomonas resinovorans]|nr:hypothetical protein [Pseudomonas resinovorans]MDE3737055.1 hypothetical protein [Pseudomonas resinovorans]
MAEPTSLDARTARLLPWLAAGIFFQLPRESGRAVRRVDRELDE